MYRSFDFRGKIMNTPEKCQVLNDWKNDCFCNWLNNRQYELRYNQFLNQ